MKTLLSFCFALLFTLFLYSQTGFEKVFPGLHLPLDKIAINNGNVAAISGSYLYYFDSLGNPLWDRYITFTELTYASNEQVFFDKSNNIVVAGKSDGGCDILDGANGIYITKFNVNGDSIFFKRFDIPVIVSFLDVNAIELPDSNYLFGQDGYLLWMKPNGDIIQNRIYGYLIDLEVANDSTIAALSRNNLILLDINGNPKDTVIISDAIDAQVYHDTIWMLSRYRVFTYSLLTKEFASIHIPENINFKGIGNDAQGIFIWGDTASTNRPIILHYKNENWLSLFSPTDNISKIDNIKWQDNYYYFSGQESFSFIKKTKNFELLSNKYDVELVNVKTIDIQNPDIANTTFNLEFTIVNKSDTVISSFYLYSDIIFIGFCGQEIDFRKLISDTLISPGDTIYINAAFTLPNFLVSMIRNPICFHTVAPDLYLDLVEDNNTSCRDILTSAQNVKLVQYQVNIFPNPAFNMMQIQLENNIQIESLHLYNIAGQLQNITSDISFNQATLHRNNLPVGLYWLKIQTKDGFVMKKVVFQ